jgi:hypothetical protein
MNPAPPQLGSGPYVPGSTGSGDSHEILNSIGTGAKPALPPPPPRQLTWYDYRVCGSYSENHAGVAHA